jgi:hypothetical protein
VLNFIEMKEATSKIQPSDFSTHLFWDVDSEKVDLEQSKRWLVERVLEYGNLNDWKRLKTIYGHDEIKKVVVTIRSMDEVTLSFLCVLLDLERTNFRCYTNKQSAQSFWKS